MSDGMTVLVAVLGSSAFSIVVKEIIDSRKAKKRGVSTVGEKLEQLSRKIDERERIFSEKIDEIWDRLDGRIEKLDKKLDVQKEAVEKQHLDILRLTIMSPNMPVSERLIAGSEYIKKGGNGDVKKYVHTLEERCQNGMEK